MNSKANKTKNQVNNANVLSKQEIQNRIDKISESMVSYTWRELETNGKFDKNSKLSFIRDDMLILGCDIGSETHYMRAIDSRGREISKKAFSFNNNLEGFQSAKKWALDLAVRHDKNQIVMGIEPTGHYWFCITSWMISNGISVVQVNPYAVKQIKEIEDNSQLKDDDKDPKLIANLVKDGNYGMPYLPEKLYADMRRLSMLKEQLTEDRIRCMNRIHRELKIYFPEYMDAFGKIDGMFTMEILKKAPLPEDIKALGTDGIRDIWHDAKLRGRGYSRAATILRYASESVGLKDGTYGGREAIQWFAQQVCMLEEKLNEVEDKLVEKCMEIPYADELLEIKGIGNNILTGILAEIGDISRFDDVKEIQKLAGLGLVACSSGKHKGQTKISRRGRKRLRYWLFQAAKSAVSHGEEFKTMHVYYTTREKNPLKKMQSLIVIACKILRIIFAILTKGIKYDPQKMLKDIKLPDKKVLVAA